MARQQMVKVARAARTGKDFRDYANLEPQEFTRIHDADLRRMWDALNTCYEAFANPHFTDRHGYAKMLHDILTVGQRPEAPTRSG